MQASCRPCAALCVILLTIAYIGIGFGVYANVFFLPLIIKDLGFSNIIVSYLAAISRGVRRSRDDPRFAQFRSHGERTLHVTIPTLVAALDST